jgi:hypothetical protein
LKPLDDKSLPLNEDMDAARWAREFIEANRYCYVGAERLDEGAMIGWFANAIMCGHDVGRRKLRDELTASPSAIERPYDRELKDTVLRMIGTPFHTWTRGEMEMVLGFAMEVISEAEMNRAAVSHEPATDEAQALLDRAYQFVADEQWVRDYTFFCKRKA